MAMNNPPHPGRSIRENCLDPLGLNVTEAAKVLGVARHTLSRVLNGHVASRQKAEGTRRSGGRGHQRGQLLRDSSVVGGAGPRGHPR